ncbi:MAG: hypothetical protein IJ870_03205 [Alphaproteobacteria bacterium]|nr:hypothetical protein [Alphaproteobacteria bacterium]
MKLVLFLMLFAFSAQAQTTNDGSGVSGILARYAPSALSYLSPNSQQITSYKSELCVQNNLQCATLGYTATSCPYGGIACPFDKTKLSCTLWSCKDFGLFETKPADMECEKVSNADIVCFKCQCGPGFINPEGCGGVVDTLKNDKSICAELGYTNSITECNTYLPCPSNPNKVRCLDVTGCKETSCIAKYEVPENATPITENVTCSCGGTKKVIVNWECKNGFKEEGTSCVELGCPEGQYESDDALECSTDAAKGWSKVAKTNTGGKQCYECQCNVPEEYKHLMPDNYEYDGNKNPLPRENGEYRKFETVACDGKHYKTCLSACPTDVRVPEGAVALMGSGKGCQDNQEVTCQFKWGWECNALEGYQKNAAGTACNPIACPAAHDGKYYSLAYQSKDDCEEKINAGTGWNFDPEPEGFKSGGQWCGLCQCPYDENDAVYKWSTSETDNQSDSEFIGLGCNGKYKECKIVATQYLEQLPEHVASSNERKICGKLFYEITKCEEGYELSDDTNQCLPKNCSDYNIPGDQCPDWGNCSTCTSAGVTNSKLLNCYDDNRLDTGMKQGIHYVMNADKTACCAKTCDTYDEKFFVGDTCPQGQVVIATKKNGCGETCIKCQ